jgi:predicted GIY-YIG superfamily endonuclease
MLEKEIENKILEKIKVQLKIEKSFSDLVNNFDSMFANIDFERNSFSISDYFGSGMGKAGATLKLLADNRIKEEWLREYKFKEGSVKNDFKGLYFFVNDKRPFYVGISKGVIGRILHHIKGHSHNSATLAYKIALLKYEIITGSKYSLARKDLNFKKEVEPIKDFLSSQEVIFLHIEDDYELYLFEVYCSMKLGTMLNNFETH